MRVPLRQPKTDSDWIIVGQVGAPYGVKGWNHIRSFTRPQESLFKYSPWYIQERDAWKEIACEESRRQGEGWVVKLLGVEDRDQAALYTQRLIAVRREQRKAIPQDEFYWSDLEGLAIETSSGEKLGCVKHLYENAGVDVMLVEYQGKEYHVPFIMHDTVLKVDLEAGVIVVDWTLI
jgi:16S rRNA processing protein RimM